MPAALIDHHICNQHLVPKGHPESPQRTHAINDKLIASGLHQVLKLVDAPMATERDLLRAHTQAHIDKIKSKVPTRQANPISLDGDTFLSPQSLQAALHAAGAPIQAVDLIMNGEVDAAFCNVRPPGHHAEHDKAMGFCLFNNIAVGVKYALEAYSLSRIAIVDFDVHHGNGTHDIFSNTPEVLFFSSFQHPFYPGTHIDSVSDHIINIPLASNSSGDDFRDAAKEKIFPRLRAFKPELIFISAGFDAHRDDDMSSLQFSDNDYQWISEQLRESMDKEPECLGIISVLEGGYDLASLARCAHAHIKAISKL